jgi:hypothetical protein
MEFPVFDTQDAVPEAFRESYEEREGKWRVKAAVVPDVTNLNSALQAEREKAANEEKARKKAERERDELKREQIAANNNISGEQLQRLRDEDAEKRKLELDPVKTENETLKAENRKLKLHDRVRAAAGSHWLPDRMEDGMDLVVESKRPWLTLASDSDAIVVLDKEGKPTTETLEHFLSTTYKAEKPWLYAGSGASGSGAGGSSGSGGGSGSPPAPNSKALAEKRSQVAGAL